MAPEVHTFPISLLVNDLPCLVVGGHERAGAKIRALCAAGAVVTVVAPEINENLVTGEITSHKRPYANGDAAGFQLVIAATGIDAIDRSVALDARSRAIFVNVVDDRELSTFIFPAILRRGPVSVAVSTDGRSPAFASWLRNEIERAFGDIAEPLVDIVSGARALVKQAGESTEQRDWRQLITDVADAYRVGGQEAGTKTATEIVTTWLASSRPAE